DWSSDVCSSDLSGARVGAWRESGQPDRLPRRAVPRMAGQRARRGDVAARRARACDRRRARQFRARRADADRARAADARRRRGARRAHLRADRGVAARVARRDPRAGAGPMTARLAHGRSRGLGAAVLLGLCAASGAANAREAACSALAEWAEGPDDLTITEAVYAADRTTAAGFGPPQTLP